MEKVLKILHLEDVPADAELIERELKKGGFAFEKIVVDNRDDFVNGLKEFLPDIILSDHSLPAYNSNRALEDIRGLNIVVPFILITATISEEFAVAIIKLGADDYILKDRLHRLPSAIKNALEKHRLEKEQQKFINEVIANEALLKKAEEMAHFGSFYVDNPNNFVRWSNECYRIFGYEIGEIEPSFLRFMECIHPDDREFVKQAIYGAENNQNFLKIDYRIGQGSNIKYIHSELAIEKNAEGKPMFINGFVHDVTEITRAENSLQKSEANLKTIFNTTDSAYILFAPDQTIVSFNNQAAVFIKQLHNKDIKEGVYLLDFISEKRRHVVEEAFEKAVKGETTNYEIRVFNHRGEEKWYYARWLSVTGAKDINLGVIFALSDITERKKDELEREKIANDLIQQNSALEQFAFIVSHNLRAPVANIIGLADALYSWEGANEGKQHFLNAISVSSKKLDEVVHDLNNILRISRMVNEQKQVVYFQQLVEEIKSSFSGRIADEAVVIKTDFTKLINVCCLKSYLYNIFYNLILNSINFRQSSRPPFIEIESCLHDKIFMLAFKDNGRGIDLEKYGKKIFGMYQRFDTSVEGRGMGLCMVKTQVETLGGTIRVESTVDKGATFIIELPV